MLKLRDWANADEAGTRFPPSKYVCPQCGGDTLEDIFPPNRCSSFDWRDPETGAVEAHSSGSIKHVCPMCRIAFRVNWWDITRTTATGAMEQNKGHVYISMSPLIKHGGQLLTPIDIETEKYKAKHGHYP